MFKDVYGRIANGTDLWNSLEIPSGNTYKWNDKSTYIHNPPFFQKTKLNTAPISDINNAFCLLNLGDFITTDHISPAGAIAKNSPAARYLTERNVD